MGRKIRVLCLASVMIISLWMQGMISVDRLLLKMISPVMYGGTDWDKSSERMHRISDRLISMVIPMWMTQNNRLQMASKDAYELYPTDEIRETIYEDENQTAYTVNAPVVNGQGLAYTPEMLKDYNFFLNEFYAVDSTTYADGLLDAEKFTEMDLTMELAGDSPKILIYHTHSQEAFMDSREGVWEDTVVGLGDRLKHELEERYGIRVVHVTDTFDVINGVTDRSAAYTYAEEKIWEVLETYPSIKVIIDLHRDGVDESTRLVTNINGKDTAQMMFLNGLCRTSTSGPISYLQNEYLTENLAFSFKLQSKAAQYYPNLMRRIYLRSYQYNLHILPRSLLVECGAQTNTVEEVQNAMPLLADLLYLVLSGK